MACTIGNSTCDTAFSFHSIVCCNRTEPDDLLVLMPNADLLILIMCRKRLMRRSCHVSQSKTCSLLESATVPTSASSSLQQCSLQPSKLPGPTADPTPQHPPTPPAPMRNPFRSDLHTSQPPITPPCTPYPPIPPPSRTEARANPAPAALMQCCQTRLCPGVGCKGLHPQW